MLTRELKNQMQTDIVLEEDSHFGTTTLIRPETRSRTRKPRMFQVLLHNDDFTPREFVVSLLRLVFKKSENESVEIMMKAHTGGVARVAVYPFGIAETKAHKANGFSTKNELPLRFSVEPVDADDDENSGDS